MNIIRTKQYTKEIQRFIIFCEENYDSNYGYKLYEKIEKAIQNIKTYPEMYAKIPEKTNRNIRQIVIDKYRIIYEIKNDTIYIKTIIGKNLLGNYE